MNKKTWIISVVLCMALFCCSRNMFAAPVNLNWDAVQGATGYVIATSIDNGTTWSASEDVGDVLSYLLTVPDNTLVIIKIGAYGDPGLVWRMDAGTWFNSAWSLLSPPTGQGIE
jgi:hypothetical protein